MIESKQASPESNTVHFLVPHDTGFTADLPVMPAISNRPDTILDMDIKGPFIELSLMNIITDSNLTDLTINTNISDTISYLGHIMTIGDTD